MTKVLGKADLLSAKDLLRRELYEIPGTDASVWMREMTAEHMLEFKRLRDKFIADGVKVSTPEQDIELFTAVISYSACDEEGNLLFDSPEEAKGLTQNNFNLLMDLGTKALEISKVKIGSNGLTSEVAEDLKNELTSSSLGNSPSSSDEPEERS